MPKLVRSQFRVGLRTLVWEEIETKQTILKGLVKLLYRLW
jgi:hypothetical protein